MDCKQVRERIESDPAVLEQDYADHTEQCEACNAYAERLRNAEALIHEALRFDVSVLKHRVEAQAAGPAHNRAWQKSYVGVAAVMVVGLAVWLGRGIGLSEQPSGDYSALVAEVAAHWYEEPDSWVQTDVRISPASLQEVILGKAEIDISRLGELSYAMSCFVRGEWVPHLVMQGSNGPVMLLLLPHEAVTGPQPLDLPEEGLSGTIVPLGEGSVAIMGERNEPLEVIRERLDAAVEWSI